MLYNIHDSQFSKILKQLIFWISLGSMLGLFIFLLNSEIKLPQHQITLEIDIKNKANICTPKDEKELFSKKIYEILDF